MNYERLFLYDDWANREEARHLRALASPPAQALRVFAHIAGTEWLWISRLRGEASPAPVWPEWDLTRCEEEIARLYHEWKSILPVVDLHQVVEYVNSKGERWMSSADDILLHVIVHGGYHRGQIATLVRQSGETPAYTDYIHCIRSGLVE